eukprot:29138-Hanusia_phi.AAC.1
MCWLQDSPRLRLVWSCLRAITAEVGRAAIRGKRGEARARDPDAERVPGGETSNPCEEKSGCFRQTDRAAAVLELPCAEEDPRSNPHSALPSGGGGQTYQRAREDPVAREQSAVVEQSGGADGGAGAGAAAGAAAGACCYCQSLLACCLLLLSDRRAQGRAGLW